MSLTPARTAMIGELVLNSFGGAGAAGVAPGGPPLFLFQVQTIRATGNEH